jgi:hypothetical protein
MITSCAINLEHVWKSKPKHEQQVSYSKNLSFFKRSIPGGLFPINRHLLALNGHGSHVSLEVIKQAQQFGLDMITLPSHTSHVLQPLDVNCFKPFKTIFFLKRTNNMVKSNYN